MSALLLIDTNVRLYQEIAAAAKPTTAVVLFDSRASSLDDIVAQVKALSSHSFTSVGLVQDGTNMMASYRIVRDQTPCALQNLETDGMGSWSSVTTFLQNLQSQTEMAVFDFISCQLDANTGFSYAIAQISRQLHVKLRASKDITGNLAEGGNWVQESDGVNIQDVYFTDAIDQYRGVLLASFFGFGRSNTSQMVTAANPKYNMVSPEFPVLYMVKALMSSEITVWGSSNDGGSGAPTGTEYTAIAATSSAFAALKPDGSITAWGSSSYGGSGAPTGTGYTAIAATSSAFAALKPDGSITAWGSSSSGGSGAPTGLGYTAIASNGYAFAALGFNGTITAWGGSSSGGTGAPTGAGYTAIASNGYGFAALKSDRSITAWGDAYNGGSGAPTGTGYTAIAANYYAFAALKSDGSITAWGNSSSGGSGAPTGAGYTAIAATYSAFAALREDGSITAWGNSGGSGAPGGTGYTAIASRDDAFAALGPNGSITAWGMSYGGTVPTNTGYTAIASNGYGFAALGFNGTITAWGNSSYGGTGAPTDTGYTAIASNGYAFAALGFNGTITAWGGSSSGGTGAPTGAGYTAIAATATSFAALKPSVQIVTKGATVADLVAAGTGIRWYSTASGGTALHVSTLLKKGIYYVSQTINGVESGRIGFLVLVKVLPIVQSITATQLFNNTVKVSWTIPRYLTDVIIQRYIIKTLNNDKSPTGIPDIALDRPILETHIQGLSKDMSYMFSIETIDALGTSSYPIYSAPLKITPTTVLATFDNTKAYAFNKAEATVSWNKVGDYIVTNTAAPQYPIYVSNNNTCLVTYLKGGLNYSFTVMALGENAPVSSNSISVKTVPSAPTNINSNVRGSSVDITFTCLGDGGSDITYSVYYSTTEFYLSNLVAQTTKISSNTESVAITGLPRARYYYIVVASNSVGDSIITKYPYLNTFEIWQ